jgi:hypothetical protein
MPFFALQQQQQEFFFSSAVSASLMQLFTLPFA